MQGQDKVLIVDDDPFNISILQELLEDEYELAIAESGEDALIQAEKFRPDLILLDIMMPGMDGYDTCKRLRANTKLKYSKIVLVSAKAMLAERLKGYEAGADDYVTKPFDHAELLAKVKVFLRLKFMEELDELKSDFLTLLAHEMRTPLTKIMSPADLLARNDDIPSEERRSFAKMILQAASRLESIIEQASLIFSFRSGKVDLDLDDGVTDLGETAKTIIESRKEQAESKGAVIVLNCEDGSVVSSGSRYVQLVLGTLLDWMIEWCSSEGRINVTIGKGDGETRLSVGGPVKDMGAESLSHMFEAFSTDDVNHYSGEIDLQLPLIREIVRHFGGDVMVTSDAPNEIDIRVRMPRRDETDAGGKGFGDARVMND
jgi:DNA-binding response OmpR family regulator